MKKRLMEKQNLTEVIESEQPVSAEGTKNKLVDLRNISKAFDGETVLDGINLSIHDKEFVTLLGPSGCGKTTTLRIIGGFETPDIGEVFFDGVKINDVPPHKRQVNTVFQKYALFPHLNVYDNIAFGLRIAKVAETEPELASCMVRECIYRGFCPEFMKCGYADTEEYQKELAEYRKID